METARGIGPEQLCALMTGFRDALRAHQEVINRLNVYPVPDGDTGTNMALTLEAVVAELEQLRPGADPADGSPDAPPSAMAAACKAIAHGSLMGARGNSGVILSQLLRGMSGVLAAGTEAGPLELSRALRAASDAADQAVLRPVEGTILTVARAAAQGAEDAHGPDGTGVAAAAGAVGDGVVRVLEAARVAAGEALERTPEMLPVLAQAGVVDAGGTGFVLLLDAALSVVDGRPLPVPPEVPVSRVAQASPVGESGGDPAVAGPDGSPGHDSLRYEVMYLLHAADETMPAFKEVWAGLGDSIVVVGGDGLWNCHIHTNEVGPSIEAALDAGRPSDIRVTDLLDQVEEERWVREGSLHPAEAPPVGPPPRTAVVAVANGEGVGRIFRSLGVHDLVAGGQSMNPSTAQILEVVEALRSPEVVLLPNNDNIRPVANQVCELASKPVRVVPTSGIVEGFAALLEYDPEAPCDDNAVAMAASARRVVAGEVTQAVRDAAGPAGRIAQGDWLGLSRDGVEVVAGSVAEATCGLLDKLVGAGHELVTLIEGDGARTGDTRRVREWLGECHPEVAVEVHHGGQPLYPYLISIE